ncbi:C-C chemokine receptor type 6a [Narcine bancroftii]|uniref:C-C chemokine receptor type 6a n=1 Tax=Narcine bancroftii TaxID=1343680 RepID=UPI003831A823
MIMEINGSDEIYDYTYNYNYTYDDIEFLCVINDYGKLSIFITILYSITTVIAIIGNGLVVLTYLFYKGIRSMTDVYLMNLAIADIFFVITLPFRAVEVTEGWIFDDIGCKILESIYSINFYSGMFLLTVISIDRYISIVHATKSFNYKVKALLYSKIICLAIWLAGIIVTLPTFIFSTKYLLQTSRKVVCNIRYPKNISSIGKVITPTIQLTLGFFIPLLIMVYCYSLIIKTLLQTKNRQRNKAFRIVIAVVASFVTCQVPYNVVVGYGLFRTTDCNIFQTKFILNKVTQSFAFFHCCLNPFLYAFISVKFRFYFLKIIQDIWCLSKRYITSHNNSASVVSRCISDFDIDSPSSFNVS